MDDKVFDVSSSDRGEPSHNSRPLIVGHHPAMSDPMMRPRGPISQPAQPAKPYSPPAPEAAKPVFPEVPPITPSDPNTLAPIDATISGDVEPSRPVDNNQHFMHTDMHAPHQDSTRPHHHLTPAPISHPQSSKSKKTLLVFFLVLVIAAALYLAIDAGVIGKNINLPFHVFKQKNEPKPAVDLNPESVANKTTTPSTAAQALPAGYVTYKLTGTGLNIPYPSAWGAPTVNTELGFAKRGANAKADVNYAYVINFATNKDVQIAITSGQYLPPTRSSATYYDFLQWCLGSIDSTKYFKQQMHFTTVAGVDTPTTTTCDQGPLTDVTKINDTTIVQLGTKEASGAVLGDLYTRNLKIAALPVMRVKDATSKNADDVKKVLDNLTLDSSAQTKQ